MSLSYYPELKYLKYECLGFGYFIHKKGAPLGFSHTSDAAHRRARVASERTNAERTSTAKSSSPPHALFRESDAREAL